MNGSDLNKLIGGELINYDVDLDILGVAPPGKDTTSDAVFLFNSTYDISNLNARLLVVKELNKAFKYTQIIHPNPRLAMAKVMHHFYKNKNGIMPGISKYADIDPSATLSKSIQVDAFVSIGKNSVINQNTRIHSSVSIGENCQIGNNCVIFPNVTIYDNCKIGNNTIIHANSVIGADGFGYEKENDEWIKIPQISGVIIGDSVEIGSNTTIDSGCLIATEIDSGVKIDNMVH
ncbi:MAG: UDP-3-O-(3-hydroxymyristoyl)glucosamine N-acyltransferase, partial [Candidatus Margulisiibacteriota bacterium]